MLSDEDQAALFDRFDLSCARLDSGVDTVQQYDARIVRSLQKRADRFCGINSPAMEPLQGRRFDRLNPEFHRSPARDESRRASGRPSFREILRREARRHPVTSGRRPPNPQVSVIPQLSQPTDSAQDPTKRRQNPARRIARCQGPKAGLYTQAAPEDFAAVMSDRLTHSEKPGLREPSWSRAAGQLGGLSFSLGILWVLAWQCRDVSYLLTLALSLPAGILMVGLFNILHDCAHLSFVPSRSGNLAIGRGIGLLTLTPFGFWRRAHMQHHGRSGNLDRRGVQDVDTLTVREFRSLSRWRQRSYRAYRNPLVLLLFGGPYLFLVQYRLPIGVRADRQAWLSTQGTNLALLGAGTVVGSTVGLADFLRVHGPIFLVSTWIGVWLYYVQHQFENTYWAKAASWKRERAALSGSSYLELPSWLRWMTGNSNIHNLHHLDPRIPSYNLWQVAAGQPNLAAASRVNLAEAIRATRLALWDENAQRLVSFDEATPSPSRPST